MQELSTPSHLTAKDIWQEHLSDEWEHWERVIRDEWAVPPGGNSWILYHDAYVPDNIVKLLPGDKKTYKILDVGSGPRSAFGNQIKNKSVDLVCCDPLADKYTELLKKYRIPQVVPLMQVEAEKLLEHFSFNQFDIVLARNCLDHAYSPEQCILQMAAVTNNCVYLLHCVNEGANANYHGLHKWDFELINGDFVIKGKDDVLNFTKKYAHLFEMQCRQYDEVWCKQTQHWIEVILRKKEVKD
jgi:hypothetical protein